MIRVLVIQVPNVDDVSNLYFKTILRPTQCTNIQRQRQRQRYFNANASRIVLKMLLEFDVLTIEALIRAYFLYVYTYLRSPMPALLLTNEFGKPMPSIDATKLCVLDSISLVACQTVKTTRKIKKKKQKSFFFENLSARVPNRINYQSTLLALVCVSVYFLMRYFCFVYRVS